MLTMNEIFFAMQLAGLGYVVCCILTMDKYLLCRYYDFLIWLERKAAWLAYPLGYCEKCFTGQVALWVWLVINWQEYQLGWFVATLRHGLFIATAILAVYVIKISINKWK